MPVLKHIKKNPKKAGTSPGTVVFIGKKKIENTGIELIDYSETQVEEKQVREVKEIQPFKEKPSVTWINVNGIHETKVISSIGELFDLHSLVLEDIVNTNQRPKMENFESSLFFVLKMIDFEDKKNELNIEQVSIILGSNFVVSFQEKKGDVFDSVRERIRTGKGRIRKMGSGYLAYALIDAIVDSYFFTLEKIGEEIEVLEEKVMQNPSPKELNTIYRLKHDLIFLRKSVWPLREVISALEKDESKLIEKHTRVFLRDVYDHSIQVIDTVETYRDMVSGLLDIYLSSISNKMNEVMKVLTVIATIFIPLTFIAGVYGMNFKFMPELEISWAYPLLWLIMISIGVSMFFYFRKKEWI